MPPKKKQRVSGGGQTANSKFVSQAPQTMDDVCRGRVLLRDWILDAYKGRHGFETKLKFPLNEGGSFLQMVQRAWADADTLHADSLQLLKKLGIVTNDFSVEDFRNEYLTMVDGVWLSKSSGSFGIAGLSAFHGYVLQDLDLDVVVRRPKLLERAQHGERSRHREVHFFDWMAGGQGGWSWEALRY